MTVSTAPRLSQTLAYTVMAKDDHMYFSRAQGDPSFSENQAYTVRAKDDHRYFSGAEANPSFHCWG